MNDLRSKGVALDEDELGNINGGMALVSCGVKKSNDLVYKETNGKKNYNKKNLLFNGNKYDKMNLLQEDVDIPGSKLVSGGSLDSGMC
ncbi:MAG: hypothetical protein K6E98_09610 [Lachnospiraceae bacterium]|nr:hypothetical protein [Lachnospiraceae bacterium]